MRLAVDDHADHGRLIGNPGCRGREVDISPMRNYIKLGGRESMMSMRSPMPKLLAQNIVGMNPDLVFVHHGRGAAHDLFMGTIRGKGIRTAVYLCDEPYECGETSLYSPSKYSLPVSSRT